MNVQQALMQHGEWKLRFRTAIVERQALDEEAACSDRRCALGSWLHGEAREQFGHLESYQDCRTKHAAFHEEAGKIAKTINTGNYPEAEAQLGLSSPFSVISGGLAAALIKLKKETESGDY
ncbi:MAG: CZB domain-containing protein [Thiobacillaceae bacterium]